MKQAEESVSRSICETLQRPAVQDRKFHMLRAFGFSVQQGRFLHWNKLICHENLAIFRGLSEGLYDAICCQKKTRKSSGNKLGLGQLQVGEAAADHVLENKG